MNSYNPGNQGAMEFLVKHKFLTFLGIFLVAGLFYFSLSHKAFAATCTSAATGNWNATATWTGCTGGNGSVANTPGSNDTAIITTTHNVTVTANETVGALQFGSASTAGVVKVNSGITLTVSGAITVVSNLAANTAGTIQDGTGAGAIVAGSVAVGNSTGTTTTANTTTLTATITNFTVNGAINTTCQTAGTGTRKNGVVVNLSGGTLTTTGTITLCSASGNATQFNMNLGNQNGTLITSAATPWSVLGNSVATLNGTSATVNYSGASQAVLNTTYKNLTLSGSGTATGGVAVQGNLITSGTVTYTVGGAVTGNLTVGAGTNITIGAFTITGTTTVNGTLTLQASTLTGAVTVNSGGSLGTSGGTVTVTINGGITNNGGTVSTNALDTITFAATQSLAGNTSMSLGKVAISGAVTVTNNNTAIVTIGATTGTVAGSTLTQGTNSTLVISSSTFLATGTFNASATGNTVNYSAASPVCKAGTATYYNLIFSGSGSASGCTAVTSVLDDLTIGAGVTYTASSGILTIGGSFLNSGTFTANGGTVAFNNSAFVSVLSGNGTIFNNFTVTTAGKNLQFTAGHTFRINGVFTVTGSSGNNVVLTSTTGSSSWTINHQGTESISYATVSWSACDAGSTVITANDGTNTDGGNNGTCWRFDNNIVVSGFVINSKANDVWTGCDGVTSNISVSGNGNAKVSVPCSTADGSYSVSVPGFSGYVIVAFMDTAGGDKGAVYTKAANSDFGGLNIYKNQVVIESENGSAITNANINTFDKSNDSRIPIASDGTNVVVDSGVQINVLTGFTYAPGGAVTTPSLQVSGTFTAGGSVTLTGSGTGDCTTEPGTMRPLCISSGSVSFGSQSVTFAGTSNSVIETAPTYFQVYFTPSSGSPVYTIGIASSPTLTVTSGIQVDGGIVDCATNNPNITVQSLYITSNGAWTKGTGTLTLKVTGTVVAWRDDTVSKQDVGNVVIGSGTSTPVAQLGGSVKATFLNIQTANTLSVNGSNTITLTAASGLAVFTRVGTFLQSTGTVEFVGDGTPNALTSGTITFYNLKMSPVLTVNQTYITGAGAITVSNNFDINPSGTGTLSVSLGGAITVTGTTTVTRTGSATSSVSSSTLTSGNLVIGTACSVTSSLVLNGTSGTLLVNNGTAPSSATVKSDADVTLFSGVTTIIVTVSPTITASRTYNMGSWAAGGITVNPSSSGNFQLTVNQQTPFSDTADDISLQRTGSATAVYNTNNYDLLIMMITIGSGTTFNAGSSSITFTALIGADGVSNSGTFNAGTSTVIYTMNAGHTLTSGNIDFYNLQLIPTLTNTDIIYTLGTGIINVNNNFTISPIKSVGVLRTLAVQVNSPITVGGTLNVSNNGASAAGYFNISSGNSVTVGNIIVSSTSSYSGNGNPITLTGGSGTLFTSAGTLLSVVGVLTVKATGNVTLSNVALYPGSFVCDSGANTVTLGAALTVSSTGALNINSGTLKDNGFAITGISTSTMSMASGATLQLGSAATATAFPSNFVAANISLDPNSTVAYVAGVAQTVSTAPAYGNLSVGTNQDTTAGVTYTSAAGTLTVNGTLTIGNASSTNSDTLQLNTNDPITDVNGGIAITSKGILQASNTSAFTVAGDFSNSGTFTHNSGSITFDTTNTSNIGGSASTTFNNFSSTAAGKTIKFLHHTSNLPLYTFAGTFTLTGASGNNIIVTSDDGTNRWLAQFNSAQPSSVTYVTLSDSGCSASSQVVTMNGTNINDGNNGTCWDFGVVSVYKLQGTVYATGANETTALATSPSMKLAVGATTSYTTTAAANGTFSVDLASQPVAGTVVTIWLNGATEKGSLVFKYGSGCNGGISGGDCTGLSVIQNKVIISNKHTGTITNADLSACDNDSGTACGSTPNTDIGFTSNGGVLTTTFASNILKVDSGTEYAPGGNVNVQKLFVAGTYTGSTETLSLSGTGTGITCTDSSHMPLCTSGTFNAPAVVDFTGGTGTLVRAGSYAGLGIKPGANSATHTLQAGTFTISGNMTLGNGTNTVVVVDATANNPTITTTGASSVLAVANNTEFKAPSTTITLSGNGSPFTIGATNAIFTPDTGTVQYTNTTSANITATTYNNLTIGGTGTYTLPSADVTLRGNLVVTTGAAVTKSASNSLIFAKGSAQTITGNAVNSDLGRIKVSSNTTNTSLSMGSSLKVTLLTVDASQTFITGANILTITGSGTTPLSIGAGATFTASTNSTVDYIGNAASTVVPATSYYNLGLKPAGANALVLGSGTFTINNNLAVGDGTNAGATASANNPTITVGGSLSIGAGSALVSTSGLLTVAGDFTNSGTFTHNSGTVALSGSGTTSTIAGATTFNNFRCVNNDGIACANKTIKFTATQTFTFAGTFTITGTASNRISVQSTTTGTTNTQWLATFQNAQPSSVTYATITNSGCVSSQNVTLYTSDSVDGGNNGTCWVFVSVRTISGAIYQSDGTTVDPTIRSVKLSLNGAAAQTASSTVSTGAFSFSVNGPQTGDIMTIWINGETPKGTTVLRFGTSCTGTPDCTGIKVVAGQVRLEQKDATAFANSMLSACNNTAGTGCSTSDIGFTTSGSALTVSSGRTLIIPSGTTFTPGGNVTAPAINNAGTFNPGNNTITVSNASSPLTNTGTLSIGTSTFAFTGNGAVVPNIAYHNLSLVPSGASSQILGSGTYSVGGNLSIGDGTNAGATASSNNTVINVSGNTIINSAAEFARGTGAWNLAGNLTVDGTLSGSATQTITVGGSVTGSGAVTGSGLTLEHRISSNKTFGATGGSAVWEIDALKFSNSNNSSTPVTITTSTGGTGQINVLTLSVGKVTDATGATTTLNAGNRTWQIGKTASATSVCGGTSDLDVTSKGVLTAGTSTINFECNNGTETLPAVTYYNLGLGALPDDQVAAVFSLSGATTVGNNLTVGNATSANPDVLTTSESSHSLAANNLSITAKGSLLANASTITVGGNWTNGGSFTKGNSTVVFDTLANTSALAGATNFNNFTVETPGKQMRFTDGQTFGVSGLLTLTGSTGSLVDLKSVSGQAPWTINFTGTSNVTYTSVAYSSCTSPTPAISMTGTGNVNGGSNGACWSFPVVTISYRGGGHGSTGGGAGNVNNSTNTSGGVSGGGGGTNDGSGSEPGAGSNVSEPNNSGYKSPSILASSSAVGTLAWSTPENASSSNSSFTLAAGENAQTHYLIATNFGFSLPSNAVINGILVGVEKKITSTDLFRSAIDANVRLVRGGSVLPTDKSLTSLWSTTKSYYTYGSPTDTWGTSWTYSDINSSNFGFAISAYLLSETSPAEVGIDHIRIKVFYTATEGGGESSAGGGGGATP